MESDAQRNPLDLLEEAWTTYLQQERCEPIDSTFGAIDVEIHLANAIAELIHSDESREAIAQLFFCNKLSRMNLTEVPCRDSVLQVTPLVIAVDKADVQTLLWFVEQQVADAAQGPDMGGLSSGPASGEHFARYSLRECAMKCLNCLLTCEEGRGVFRRSRMRDKVLTTSIGWCESAFYSWSRGYADNFKLFAETLR